jgi:hypothetical protein
MHESRRPALLWLDPKHLLVKYFHLMCTHASGTELIMHLILTKKIKIKIETLRFGSLPSKILFC